MSEPFDVKKKRHLDMSVAHCYEESAPVPEKTKIAPTSKVASAESLTVPENVHSAPSETARARSISGQHTQKTQSRLRLTRKQQLQQRQTIKDNDRQKQHADRTKVVLSPQQQVDEAQFAQIIANMFRKHYFDAWAAELRAQRPFVNDRGNLKKLREELHQHLYEDLKSHCSEALNNWDACVAPAIENMHEFNCITQEAVIQTQKTLCRIEEQLQDLQARLSKFENSAE